MLCVVGFDWGVGVLIYFKGEGIGDDGFSDNWILFNFVFVCNGLG